jgi:hypothetical protein
MLRPTACTKDSVGLAARLAHRSLRVPARAPYNRLKLKRRTASLASAVGLSNLGPFAFSDSGMRNGGSAFVSWN